MTWKRGDRGYVAHPDEVERVTYVESGVGGRNFGRGFDAPCVVRGRLEEYVVDERTLFASPTAAAIYSAELKRMYDAYDDAIPGGGGSVDGEDYYGPNAPEWDADGRL